MYLFEIVLFGLAVSMDGFATGTAYGIRRLRIPFFSLLLICLSSAGAVALTMLLGKYISTLFSPRVAALIGGTLLILIGVVISIKEWQEQKTDAEFRTVPSQEQGYSYWDVLMAILRDPYLADADDSGAISLAEAVALGLALALDAFGAGLGLAMTGINPWLVAVTVALCKFFLVTMGLYLGQCLNGKNRRFSLLAGALLVLLGIINLALPG